MIAYRHGSVPEIMEDGVTGFVVRQPGRSSARSAQASTSIDRGACREVFDQRFTVAAYGGQLCAHLSRIASSWKPRAADGAMKHSHDDRRIMVEKIQLGEQWYILATSSPTDERRRVLKHNETLSRCSIASATSNPSGSGEEGIYHGDTCFLSHQELLIDGVRPMYLNSTVKDDNGLFIIELMNPDLHPDGRDRIHKGDLHIFRAKLLWNDACHEHVRVVNFGLEPVEMTLSIEFGVGLQRHIRSARIQTRAGAAQYLPPQVGENELLLRYRGLDQSFARPALRCDPTPARLTCRAGRIRCLAAAERRGASVPDDRLRIEQTSRTGKSPAAPVDYFGAFNCVTQAVSVALAQSLQDRYLGSPFQ